MQCSKIITLNRKTNKRVFFIPMSRAQIPLIQCKYAKILSNKESTKHRESSREAQND